METPIHVVMGIGVAAIAVAGGVLVALVAVLRRPAAARRAGNHSDPRKSPELSSGPLSTPEPVTGFCPVCGAELPADSPQGLCPRCLLQCGLSRAEQTPIPSEQGETAAYQRPTTAPAVAELAPLFPQLEILELIGQGGMGAVYKARQIKLDRLVAVKILPAEWGKDPAFAERFAREARALGRLGHRHIVGVHDFGETGGLYYLLMEFVDGVNLRQLLQDGPMKPEQALQLIPQICDALQYAHEEGVVHRDIKPENILLDKRGQVKIADFGLAKLMRRSAAEFTLTGSRQVMGTLDYMAPEQRTAPQEVDHRADIYSLGVVFYEMLTGELPLGRFAPPSEKAAVDERLDAVVFRALERDPGRRYQRISEVKSDVESIAGVKPTTAAPAHPSAMVQRNLDQEMTQLRVKAPAAALLLTGVVILFEGIALAFAFGVAGRGPGGWWGRDMAPGMFGGILIAGALALLALVATVIGGAIKMARLENYGLVMAAIILAMLPFSCHFIIGLPVGAWALWVLSRREVQAAFARNLRRSKRPAATPEQRTGPIYGMLRSAFRAMITLIVHRSRAASSSQAAGAGQGSAAWHNPVETSRLLSARQGEATPVRQARTTDKEGVPPSGEQRRNSVGMAILLSVVVVIGAALCFGVAMLWNSSEQTTQTKRPSHEAGLAFHRGDVRLLGTSVSVEQYHQINDILRSADQEYLKLEARHTQEPKSEDANSRMLTVLAFPEELKTLEDRVWLQLGTVLVHVGQLDKARQLLPLRGSLFPFGSEEFTIMIQREDEEGFRWKVSKKGDPATGTWIHGPELPPEYARFWNRGVVRQSAKE